MKNFNSRILIVEDDLNLLHYLKEFFADDFDQVVTACDGISAYLSLQEGMPDVILTDLHMPGFDGIEFITRLRADGHDTPVILASNNVDSEHLKKAIKLGVVDFLEKPYNDNDLMKAVYRVVQISSREYELPALAKKFGEDSIEVKKHQKMIGLLKAMSSKK